MKHVSRALLAVLLCGLVTVGACEFTDVGDLDPAFGDAYVIITTLPNPDNSVRDVRPVLLDDALRITLQYAGGCAEHRFTLQNRRRSDTAEIWLDHDSQDDTCEALITDTLDVPLPDLILARTHIHLLGPEDAAFELR